MAFKMQYEQDLNRPDQRQSHPLKLISTNIDLHYSTTNDLGAKCGAITQPVHGPSKRYRGAELAANISLATKCVKCANAPKKIEKAT